MVGNGCTNWELNYGPSLPATVYNFNMMPRRLMDKFEENGCKFSVGHVMHYDNPLACYTAWSEMNKLYLKNVNIYDLYRKDWDILG
jgi:hypothetical protein